jgi:hypothetical protein
VSAVVATPHHRCSAGAPLPPSACCAPGAGTTPPLLKPSLPCQRCTSPPPTPCLRSPCAAAAFRRHTSRWARLWRPIRRDNGPADGRFAQSHLAPPATVSVMYPCPHVACGRTRGPPLASGAFFCFSWAHCRGRPVGRETSVICTAPVMLEAILLACRVALHRCGATAAVLRSCPGMPLLVRESVGTCTSTRRQCPSNFGQAAQRCSTPQCSDTHGLLTLLVCQLAAAVTEYRGHWAPRAVTGDELMRNRGARFMSHLRSNFGRLKYAGCVGGRLWPNVCTDLCHRRTVVGLFQLRNHQCCRRACGCTILVELCSIHCRRAARRCGISEPALCAARGTTQQHSVARWSPRLASCVGRYRSSTTGTLDEAGKTAFRRPPIQAAALFLSHTQQK